MGVDYTEKLAYGIHLTVAEIKASMVVLGEDESGCDEEWAECVAQHLSCTAVAFGSMYRENGVTFVIGPKIIRDDTAATMTVDLVGLAKLREFAAKHWSAKRIGWTLGLLVD